jgi:outer membrane protein OmpA-like peptidoglycan-associated protein
VRRALLLLALAGCAGTELRERTATVDQQITTARDNGAVRCAPVELAMAESHNEFAKTELDQGHYRPAKDELAVAEENAKAAVEKSPRDRCVPKQAPVIGDKDGDGLKDDVDECPNDPEDKDGFQDEDGCPDPDNDADGIPDAADKCPNDPEDKDGFQDEDGCPDPDNDGDGLVDKIDQCPDEPEDKDGFEDDDGCPDPDNDKDGIPDDKDKCPNDPAPGTIDGCPQKYQLIVVTENKIELKQTVFFDTNKATIKKVSFPLLDEVAQALKDNPTIKVRIEGHTDSQGNDNFNMKLSQRRAESVRTYLIGKGIEADRMVPQGYGETVPIADNRTSAGRAQNRRVEFVITSR